MKDKTLHLLKAIGFTQEEIERVSKKAGTNVNLLPTVFMRQLERNKYQTRPCGRGYRKMSVEDFTNIIEKFKEKVLKNPLKAIAKLAKGNVLKS